MATFSIRDAIPEDVSGIVQLYFRVEDHPGFDPDECTRWWRWLIQQNPGGIRKALVATDENDRVIGHYAIVPFQFRARGEQFPAGFLCWLQVAEEFRTELVFPRLELRILKDYPNLGMRFAYGLITRPAVLAAHGAFGFKKVMTLPVLARPLQLGKLARTLVGNRFFGALLGVAGDLLSPLLRFVRPAVPPGVRVEMIDAFDEGWDAFLTRAGSAFPLTTARTPDILNWRFSRYRERGYRILAAREAGQPCGYAVVRMMPMKQFSVLALADILYESSRPSVGRALIRAVLDEATRQKADLCSCLINPENPMTSLLRANLFLTTPESFTLIVHEPRGSSLNLTASRPAEWHLTWFDHDFV